MKKISLLLFTIISITLLGQDTISVLWIGNSYTGANNLPLLTKNVANSVGNQINYDSHTPGGQRFMNHAVNATAINKIFSQPWDYVTLQAQSQEPSWPDFQVQNEVFPHARTLCDSIRSNNSCTKPVFYMTWGRENGDAGNCGGWPPVCTYEGMDSILNQNYQTMGIDNKALVSPVGAVWNYIRYNHPSIDLYSNDGSHPSQTGSYVAALTFHTMFFKSNPELIPFNYTIDSLIADTIKFAVKSVVYDSLFKWNVGKFDAVNQTFLVGCDSVVYDNTVILKDTLFTDTLVGQSFFGCDSIITFSVLIGNRDTVNLDTIVNSNTYDFNGLILNESGSYSSLLVNKDGCDSLVNLELTLKANFLIEETKREIKVYPNPMKDRIFIESNTFINFLQIFNLQGELMLEDDFDNSDRLMIDISNLRNGTYFMEIDFEDGGSEMKRIIKND